MRHSRGSCCLLPYAHLSAAAAAASNLPACLPARPPACLLPCSDKFTGVVSEIVSGDCLVVRDAAGAGPSAERRINLSSIRAPRMGTRDRAPEPWAVEAKEFLRCVVLCVCMCMCVFV